MLYDLTLRLLKILQGFFCQIAVYINMDASAPRFYGFFVCWQLSQAKILACLEYVNENILKDE